MILARVRILNVQSVLRSIEKAMTNQIKKSDLYEEIGAFSVERIQQETRKGRDLSTGGKIKDTSDSTKDIKALIEGKPKRKTSKKQNSEQKQKPRKKTIWKSLKQAFKKFIRPKRRPMSRPKKTESIITPSAITMKPPPPSFFRSLVSQITQSGQLLDSLKADINQNRGTITVEPTGSRQEIKYVWTKTGKPVKFLTDDSPITDNKELASDLKRRGFTFLGMDKKGLKRIRRLVLDEIRRTILKLKLR